MHLEANGIYPQLLVQTKEEGSPFRGDKRGDAERKGVNKSSGVNGENHAK
jgi:hypothetical protein